MSKHYALLFALAPLDAEDMLSNVTALQGKPLQWDRRGRFALAYQTLDDNEIATLFPADYENDPDQLGLVVRSFQKVQEQIGNKVPFITFRFGTIVLSLSDVWEQVAEHVTELVDCFQKIRGKEEWGLQILEPVHTGGTDDAAITGSDTGRDYLRQLAQAKHEETARKGERNSFLGALEDRLMGLVTDHVELTPGRVLEDGQIVRVNLSLLVPHQDAHHLTALVEDEAQIARKCGMSLRLTGPWPPQSFSAFNFQQTK